MEGDFARAYTNGDNSTSVSTDTIKNVVNVVARENTGLCTEEFCQVLAQKYLDTYPQIASVALTVHETKWSRLSFGGKPHPHSFVLDSNGKPTVELSSVRGGATTMSSGVDGFTFMKSTQSGWENYVKDATPRSRRPPTGCARPAWWRRGNGRASLRTIPRPTARSSTPCWRCSR